MKSIVLISLFLLPVIGCASSTKIYDTQKSKYLKLEQLNKVLPAQAQIILGEFHNDEAIQYAQAKIIRSKVEYEKARRDFTVNWEFINHTDHKNTQKYYQDYINDKISVKRFISLTAGKNNYSYAPIVSVTKMLDGEFKGVNLARKLKQKVIKEGLGSIDPILVPDFHYDGGPEYKERFTKVMGDHVPADQLDAYFTAQCLTDSVMAEQVHLNDTKSLNFLIAGSFHTDFFDATVARLKTLTQKPIVTFKFINESSLSTNEVQEIIQGDKNYGHYADYVIIVTN